MKEKLDNLYKLVYVAEKSLGEAVIKLTEEKDWKDEITRKILLEEASVLHVRVRDFLGAIGTLRRAYRPWGVRDGEKESER